MKTFEGEDAGEEEEEEEGEQWGTPNPSGAAYAQ